MLRLAVIYQLVLSILLGPMLCCCSAAQVSDATRGLVTSGSHGPARKSCCGHQHASFGGEHESNHDKKPGIPSKCPCKSGGQTHTCVAIVDKDSTAATLSTVLKFHFPCGPDTPFVPCVDIFAVTACEFDSTPDSHFVAARMLYAHHKLRC